MHSVDTEWSFKLTKVSVLLDAWSCITMQGSFYLLCVRATSVPVAKKAKDQAMGASLYLNLRLDPKMKATAGGHSILAVLKGYIWFAMLS